MQAPRLNHALNHDSSGRVNRAPLAIAQLAPLSAAACTAGTDTGAPLRLRGQYKAAGAVPCCRVAGVGVWGWGEGGAGLLLLDARPQADHDALSQLSRRASPVVGYGPILLPSRFGKSISAL